MKKLLNGKPVYEMTISDDMVSGVDMIAMVDAPAIMTNWVKMSKELKKFYSDKDKQLLFGAAMIPNMPIYRFDHVHGEYYCYFKEETIKKIASKFFEEQRTLSFNYQHQSEKKVNAVIIESWFTSKQDKSKEFGFSLPDGTWFICAKVNDEKFWNEEIKTGNVLGFSIEGYLDLEMKKLKQNNMTKNKFTEIKTTEGVQLYTPDEVIQEGSEIFVLAEDGTQSPAPNGEHVLENGSVITISDGKVTAILEISEEELSEEECDLIMKSIEPKLSALISKTIKDELSKIPAFSKTIKTDKKTELSEKEKKALALSKVRDLINSKKQK